jgi:segregation and condensation protein A
VSLASVTDDYISYLSGNISDDLPNVTLFLSIAATLVYMKSKMLLDDGSLQDTEMNDAGHNLEERLRLLSSLRSGTNAYLNSIPSPYIKLLRKKNLLSISFQPYESVNKKNLSEIASLLIQSLPEEKEKLQKVSVLRVVSLEEMIYKINKTLKTVQCKISFSKLANAMIFDSMEFKERKVSVIISFLAVLELMHGGLMNIEQSSTYGDILCEPMNEIPVVTTDIL